MGAHDDMLAAQGRAFEELQAIADLSFADRDCAAMLFDGLIRAATRERDRLKPRKACVVPAPLRVVKP